MHVARAADIGASPFSAVQSKLYRSSSDSAETSTSDRLDARYCSSAQFRRQGIHASAAGRCLAHRHGACSHQGHLGQGLSDSILHPQQLWRHHARSSSARNGKLGRAGAQHASDVSPAPPAGSSGMVLSCILVLITEACSSDGMCSGLCS